MDMTFPLLLGTYLKVPEEELKEIIVAIKSCLEDFDPIYIYNNPETIDAELTFKRNSKIFMNLIDKPFNKGE